MEFAGRGRFPIVRSHWCRACLCIGRRVGQSERKSKQSGYTEPCSVVLIRQQQNARDGGPVPRQAPKKTLRLQKSRPRNRGTDLLRHGGGVEWSPSHPTNDP